MADTDLIYGDGQDLWNPNAPRLDPATGQDSTPAPPLPTPSFGNGVAPTAGNQRQSLHWADIPDAYENIPGIFDWANDPTSDPNAKVQQFLSEQRAQGKSDEGDTDALTGFGLLGGKRMTPAGGRPMVPDQFDDPYTKLLESISKSQMGELRNNPGLNQLTGFLNSQFKDLSTSPGFSPDELAVLNTQAFEPIEALRKTSTERSLQRTANRGVLPSSGVAELDLRNVDQAYDKMRTQAGRDLAINAIDRRDTDLARAQQLATMLGLTIPQGQRSEELNLANLLYGLPRNALNDALAVLNGSPSSADLLQGANASAYQQQLQQQQQAQMWSQIAQFLAGLGL